MISFQKICLSALGSLTLASSLFAAGLESEKVAPLQNIFPNAYSSVEARHYLLDKGGDTRATGQSPMAQMRYTLGSTFFDDRLDTRVVFGLNKKDGDKIVEDRGTRVDVEYDLFSNDFLEVVPYVYTKLPKGAYGTNAKAGVATELTYALETGAGPLTFLTGFDVLGHFGSRPGPKEVSITKDGKVLTPVEMTDSELDAYSLTADMATNTVKVKEQGTKIENEFTFGVGYEPTSVRGLAFLVKTYHTNKFTPEMEFDTETNTAKIKRKINNQVVYNKTYERQTRFGVQYDINDSLYVTNDFFLRNVNAATDKRMFENVFAVNATLF